MKTKKSALKINSEYTTGNFIISGEVTISIANAKKLYTLSEAKVPKNGTTYDEEELEELNTRLEILRLYVRKIAEGILVDPDGASSSENLLNSI